MEDPKVKYWLVMEKAFLAFYSTRYEEALANYEDAVKEFPDKYVVHFRLGELYSLFGDIEKALTHFDESERLLSIQGKLDFMNKFRIKSSLALVYWMLGAEYIEIAIEEINEAESIFKKHKSLFSEKDRVRLTNNIAWYYLEKYIKSASKKNKDKKEEKEVDEYFALALEKHKKLLIILNSEYAGSHAFDTVAWFCFQNYLRTGDVKPLKDAHRFSQLMSDKLMYTAYNFVSMNTHLNHIQEIWRAYHLEGLNNSKFS